jgi:hypothetical protein
MTAEATIYRLGGNLARTEGRTTRRCLIKATAEKMSSRLCFSPSSQPRSQPVGPPRGVAGYRLPALDTYEGWLCFIGDDLLGMNPCELALERHRIVHALTMGGEPLQRLMWSVAPANGPLTVCGWLRVRLARIEQAIRTSERRHHVRHRLR